MVAQRLPALGERAMREAIVQQSLGRAGDRHRPTPRGLADDALTRFERFARRFAGQDVRAAVLFAERERIVAELHAFLKRRLAARLFAVPRRDVIAVGRDAGAFDALVRGRNGGAYGVVFRRLPRDGRRLETIRSIRRAARDCRVDDLRGVLVYDFTAGSVRTLRLGDGAVELAAA